MAGKKKDNRGRPTKYSEEVATEICTRIAEGEALRDICSRDGMPAISTVCLWAAEDREGFSERYTRALEARGWLWAEEMVGIADEGADATRDKLRVDTRKWLLTKLMPNRFGERQQLEHTGKDGGPVKTQNTVTLDPSKLDDDTLAKLMQAKGGNIDNG